MVGLNEEYEVEEGPWRPYFRNNRTPYWCGPTLLAVFLGILAIAQTISIFVMGYDPRPQDWGWYALNIVGTIVSVAYLWTERRKRRKSE